jgi:hypothetical protein
MTHSTPEAIKTNTCIPKSEKRPRIELPPARINARIEYMRTYVLIGKFIGIWPTKRALLNWMQKNGNPKPILTSNWAQKDSSPSSSWLDDRDKILEGGPYFFNSTGLYLRNWTKRFNPDKEDFTWVPVWIRLYSLPQDYWDDETLKDIGNTLGNFVKIAEQTKTNKYTSYARICVYMHIAKALPDSIF